MGTKGSAETEEKPGSSQDTPDKDDDVFWDKVYRATKIVFSGLLFLLVLSSAVVSKGALLVLIWNIFTPFNTTKPVLKTLGGHFQYRTNSKNGTNQQDITAGFTKTNVYFVWATFLVVVTPYLLSIMVNLWKVLSKKSDELRWIPLLIAIVTAIVHSVGLSIFVFSLLPAFDPISGVFYGATITCVPSLVHIVFSDKTLLIKQTGVSIKVVWPFVGRILAFIFSIISLICWCVYVYRASSPSVSVASLFMFVFVPVLVSCGWWENFGPELHPTVTSEAAIPESDAKTDKSQARPMQSSNIPVEEAETSKSEEKSNNIETFWSHIYILKDLTYTGRYKIYLLVNICKVIVTFAMLVGIYGRHIFEVSPVTNGTSVKQVSNVFASTWFYSWGTCTCSVPFTIAGVAAFTSLICHRYAYVRKSPTYVFFSNQ
ncbi:uncharacterized protein LOC128550822 [Mercenaria mercenaria]|uniref:uncharacterized protein LOC128550822 n=1 Tax=Mercenaria mercenaria TaxID=6596 RepID=UPI00234EA5D5|nr:uncharacterized protein LOC128550822 [Mercenaria mercenaria]